MEAVYYGPPYFSRPFWSEVFLQNNIDPSSLWTAVELAAFLGLSPRTVTDLASRKPERLPPRVRTLSLLRWVPSVCRAWVEANSTLARPSKGGRPRGSGRYCGT
jgi:hypothetical protein